MTHKILDNITESRFRQIAKAAIIDAIQEGKAFNKLIESCSPKHFKSIKYFSTDGTTMPNGVGYQRGYFLHECKTNSNAFILNEEVHDKQYGLAKYRGGIIVFSTDVNAIELDKNKIMNWLKQHMQTFIQRYNTSGILHKVVNKFNKSFNMPKADDAEEEYIGAYSVGNAFRGKYVGDNGEEFNESSTTIEVNGLSTEGLLYLAEMIARVFHQQTVLVKDFNANKIYMANGLRKDRTPDFSNINTKCESRSIRKKIVNEIRNGWDLEKDDIAWANDEDDGGKPFMVRIWSGSGYYLPAFGAYATAEDQALEIVVAYLEQNGDDEFFVDDEYISRLRDDLEQEGMDEDEIDEQIDETYLYVDATMEGAMQPHYIRLENLRIYPLPQRF